MRGDAGAGARRWLRAWRSPAHMERIAGVACPPLASAGTSRGHAGSRRCCGTWACRSAAIRPGGSLSWATDHRNSSASPRQSRGGRRPAGSPVPAEGARGDGKLLALCAFLGAILTENGRAQSFIPQGGRSPPPKSVGALHRTLNVQGVRLACGRRAPPCRLDPSHPRGRATLRLGVVRSVLSGPGAARRGGRLSPSSNP